MGSKGIHLWIGEHFYRMHKRRHKYHKIIGHTEYEELVTLCGRRLPGLISFRWPGVQKPSRRLYCQNCARREQHNG